jgi:hypothetical protein
MSTVYGHLKIAVEAYIHVVKEHSADSLSISQIEGMSKYSILMNNVSQSLAFGIILRADIPFKIRSLYMKLLNRVYFSREKLTSIIEFTRGDVSFEILDGKSKASKKKLAAEFLNSKLKENKKEILKGFRAHFEQLIDHVIPTLASEERDLGKMKYVYRACIFTKLGLLHGCLNFHELKYLFYILIGIVNIQDERLRENLKDTSRFQDGLLDSEQEDDFAMVWKKIEIEILSILEICSLYRDFYVKMLLNKYYNRTNTASFIAEKSEQLYRMFDLIEISSLTTTSNKVLKSQKHTGFREAGVSDSPEEDADSITVDHKIHEKLEFLFINLGKDPSQLIFPSQNNGQLAISLASESKFSVIRPRLSVTPDVAQAIKQLQRSVDGEQSIWNRYDKIFMQYNRTNLQLKKRYIELALQDFASNSNKYKNLLIKIRKAQIKSMEVLILHACRRKKVTAIIERLHRKEIEAPFQKGLQGKELGLDLEQNQDELVDSQISKNHDHHSNQNSSKKSPVNSKLLHKIHKCAKDKKTTELSEFLGDVITAFKESRNDKFASDGFYRLQMLLRAHSFTSLFGHIMAHSNFKNEQEILLHEYIIILGFYVQDNQQNQKEVTGLLPELIKCVTEFALDVSSVVVQVIRSFSSVSGVQSIIRSVVSAIETIFSSPDTSPNSELGNRVLKSKDQMRILTSIISGIIFTFGKQNIQLANFVYELIGQSDALRNLLEMKISNNLSDGLKKWAYFYLYLMIFDISKLSANCLFYLAKNSSSDSIKIIVNKYKAKEFRPLRFRLIEFFVESYLDPHSEIFEKNLYKFIINDVLINDLDMISLEFDRRQIEASRTPRNNLQVHRDITDVSEIESNSRSEMPNGRGDRPEADEPLFSKQELIDYLFSYNFSQVTGLFVIMNQVLENLKRWSLRVYSRIGNEVGGQNFSGNYDIDLTPLKNRFDELFPRGRHLSGFLSPNGEHFSIMPVHALNIKIYESQIRENFDYFVKEKLSSPFNVERLAETPKDDHVPSKPTSGTEKSIESPMDINSLCKQLKDVCIRRKISLEYLFGSFVYQSRGTFEERLNSLYKFLECENLFSFEKVRECLLEENSSVTQIFKASSTKKSESSNPSKNVLSIKKQDYIPRSFSVPFQLLNRLFEAYGLDTIKKIQREGGFTEKSERRKFLQIFQDFDDRLFSLNRYDVLIDSIKLQTDSNGLSLSQLIGVFVPNDPKNISKAQSFEVPKFFMKLNQIGLNSLIDHNKKQKNKTKGNFRTAVISSEVLRIALYHIVHSKSNKLVALCLKVLNQYIKLDSVTFTSEFFKVLSSETFLFAEFIKRLNAILVDSGMEYYDEILHGDHNRFFNCNLTSELPTTTRLSELLKNTLHLIYVVWSGKLTLDSKTLKAIEKNSGEHQLGLFKNTVSIFLKISDVLCRQSKYEYSSLDKKIVMRMFMILEISLKNSSLNIYLLWRSFNNYIGQLANICKLDFAVLKDNYFHCFYTGLLVKMVSLLSVAIKESPQKTSHSTSVRDYDCFIMLCEKIYQEIIEPNQQLFIRDKLCSLSRKGSKKVNKKCKPFKCVESFISLTHYSLYQTAFKSYLAYKEILGEAYENERDNFFRQMNDEDISKKKRNSSFDYFKMNEVKVELCLKNALLDYSFQKQLICFHLDRSLKHRFFIKLSKTRTHDDLRILFDDMLFFFEEMILNEKFSNNMLMNFAVHQADLISCVIYLMVLYTNIFLLIFVDVSNTSDTNSQSIFSFTDFVFKSINNKGQLLVIYLVISLIIVAIASYNLFAKLIISWYKSNIIVDDFASMQELSNNTKNIYVMHNNTLDRISQKIQEHIMGAFQKLRSKHPVFQKLIHMCSFDNIYALVFFLALILSIIFPFIWPILLLDIFRINSGLNNLLTSFKYNWYNLAKISWICIIVLYMYATIIFTFFNDEVAAPNSGYQSTCTSLSVCLYHTTLQGLVLYGGISEYLGQVQANTSLFWKRFALDLSFYFIILVIVLNTVYAIVIETYFIFSRKEKHKARNAEKVCYVCHRNEHELKLLDEDFSEHVKDKHNAKNYFYLFINLFLGKSSSSNYIERVLSKMVFEKDFSFMPIKPKSKLN